MNKTKEEILEQRNFFADEETVDIIYSMLDEYAEQQAVAFRDWSKTDAASVYGGNTTGQLYNLFLEHQKQQTIK